MGPESWVFWVFSRLGCSVLGCWDAWMLGCLGGGPKGPRMAWSRMGAARRPLAESLRSTGLGFNVRAAARRRRAEHFSLLCAGAESTTVVQRKPTAGLTRGLQQVIWAARTERHRMGQPRLAATWQRLGRTGRFGRFGRIGSVHATTRRRKREIEIWGLSTRIHRPGENGALDPGLSPQRARVCCRRPSEACESDLSAWQPGTVVRRYLMLVHLPWILWCRPAPGLAAQSELFVRICVCREPQCSAGARCVTTVALPTRRIRRERG